MRLSALAILIIWMLISEVPHERKIRSSILRKCEFKNGVVREVPGGIGTWANRLDP